MDYGKRAPALGWRFNRRLARDGREGDVACPTATRWTSGHPYGRAAARSAQREPRRDVNGPPAYALTQVPGVAAQVRPPGALGMDFYQSLPSLAKGTSPSNLLVRRLHAKHGRAEGAKGNNTGRCERQALCGGWRRPARPYWKEVEGGYRDEGSWTLPRTCPWSAPRPLAYAQFVTSKTVDLKKSQRRPDVIRNSTVRHPSFDDLKTTSGAAYPVSSGPGIKYWTPTGLNVPDYASSPALVGKNIAEAVAGEVTPRTGARQPGKAQDYVMDRIGRFGPAGRVRPGAPTPERDPRTGKGQARPWRSSPTRRSRAKTMRTRRSCRTC